MCGDRITEALPSTSTLQIHTGIQSWFVFLLSLVIPNVVFFNQEVPACSRLLVLNKQKEI